jgi:predicted AlkP superfamily phosphohydrolase/phosphomutase
VAHPLWIVGIDGCEPSLLDQWCAEGLLPNLAACRQGGATGTLLSTPNILTCAAWTTIATGANPGQHGLYNFAERVAGEYRLRLPTAQDRQLPAFWECASDAGRSVVVARVPMSYPVRPVNGLQVSDSLTPSPHAPGFAYPASLARDLRRRFGHAFWLEPVDLMGSGRHYRILDGLLDSVDRNFELFRYLLARERADLFFGVVREADYGGHAFWGFHSGKASTHDPYVARDLRSALRQIYQRIDRRLGELLEDLPSGANLLIVSDHGMGSNPRTPGCVGPLLEAAGLMARREPGAQTRPGAWQRARSAISRRVPWSLRRRLRPLDAATWSRGFTAFHLSEIEFDRTRAFTYLAGLAGEVWLNVAGRDPLGLVQPGAEQAELEHDLARMFLGCRDTASGAPLAQRVWRRDELFSGPHTHMLADLHVTLDLDLPLEGLRAQFRGRDLELTPPPAAPLPGSHRPRAVFVACGPDVAADGPSVDGTLMDVAPTALALLNVPIPPCVEGRPLTEALQDCVRPTAGDSLPSPAENLPPVSYTEEEMALIQQRLTHLGYL